MTTKRYGIAIIGGGISGLSLAYFLSQMDREVLLIEKANRIGGAIESHKHEDFTIELGAHTGYNSYRTLLGLIEDKPVQNQMLARQKQKYFFASEKGFQKLTKPLNFLSLFANLLKVFSAKKDNASVREYYGKILGEKNYENFGRHFFKAVLCQNAEDYPAAYFLKRRSSRKKEFPRNFTFQDGLQEIVASLQNNPKITIRCGAEIEKIEKANGYKIHTTNDVWESETIAFACYAKETARLTTEIAPKLANLLGQISYTPVSSLGIVVKKEDALRVKAFAGLLTTSEDFTSIVSRDVAPNENYRGFTIHSQGEVSEELLTQRLCKTLQISPEIIVAQRYKRNFLPQLRKGHEDFVANLQEEVEKHASILLTGNFFNGLSLEDCVQHSQEESVRYISTIRE